MSDLDPALVARCPNVPACYDWLSLDRRGVWRLRGEPVTHAGLTAFLNRHYGSDAAGNWFVRNGPQQVFARLDYTPLVLRLQADGQLTLHTGEAAGAPDTVFLDEEGNVLVHTAAGIGLLDDRDLPAFVAGCRRADGAPADEAALLGAMAGAAGVSWRGLPLQAIRRADVAGRFGFCPVPVSPPAP